MSKGKNQQQLAYRIPTAQELYDLWMSQIEPELVTANIDHVDERHAGETPEERKARYARYAEAFQMFDDHRKAVDLAVRKRCSEYTRQMDKAAEREQGTLDKATLDSLDTAIQTLP